MQSQKANHHVIIEGNLVIPQTSAKEKMVCKTLNLILLVIIFTASSKDIKYMSVDQK